LKKDQKTRITRNVGSEPGGKTPLGLRVIGGTLRGSKLKYSGDNRVRPMKDRTREAVFNLISTDSQGACVLDLFAGTGALAIEAISRGATSATLIEVHLQTMRNLKLNIEAFGLQAKCQLLQGDAFFFAKTRESMATMATLPGQHWLVFCSPPYDFYVSRQEEMIEMIETLYAAAPVGSTFVVEADRRFDFHRLQLPNADARFRTYSPAEIAIYRKLRNPE